MFQQYKDQPFDCALDFCQWWRSFTACSVVVNPQIVCQPEESAHGGPFGLYVASRLDWRRLNIITKG